jgi:hypothetical protein
MATNTSYGRNLDKTIANGDTEHFVIPLDEDEEAVRADYEITSGTLGTGSLDVSLYVYDDAGDLREIDDSDSSNWTQLGSTVNTTDTNAHDIGAQFRGGDYGFAIVSLVNSADSGELTISGDFVGNTHESANEHPLNHATADNLNEDVYTDGTAQ